MYTFKDPDLKPLPPALPPLSRPDSIPVPTPLDKSNRPEPPPARTAVKEKVSPPPSLPSTEGYRRVFTLWFSPRILQYVPTAALVLILFLSFFSWVGVYPGGEPQLTQNAWQAAFAGGTPDPDLESVSLFHKTKDGGDEGPGVSLLLIFYLLLFFPALAVTAGCLALSLGKVPVPPAVETFMPWRWALVTGVNLLLFFLLFLQLLAGFGVESSAATEAQKVSAGAQTLKTDAAKLVRVRQGEIYQKVSRTLALRLVVLLQLLAVLAAGLVFWVGQPASRPTPRLDAMW